MRSAPLLFTIDPVAASVCLLAALTCLLCWWRQRVAAAHALADARRQIQRLSVSQQSLRDAERRRIARDLHDELGQHLLALGMDAAALGRQFSAARAHASRIEQRVERATRAMRAVVQDLANDALDGGLATAVRQQIDQFSRLSGIPCQLHAEPTAFVGAPAAAMDNVVYRVLQESLSNIVRHAQASEVCVGLCRHEHAVSLTVRDNGVGLPRQPATPHSAGRGLRGIAQRVAEAGGRFDIASTPGMGTALTMSFPIS